MKSWVLLFLFLLLQLSAGLDVDVRHARPRPHGDVSQPPLVRSMVISSSGKLKGPAAPVQLVQQTPAIVQPAPAAPTQAAAPPAPVVQAPVPQQSVQGTVPQAGVQQQPLGAQQAQVAPQQPGQPVVVVPMAAAAPGAVAGAAPGTVTAGVPVISGVPAPAAVNVSTALPTASALKDDTSFFDWSITMWLCAGAAPALPLLAVLQVHFLAEDKQERFWTELQNTPFRWAARGMALYLMVACCITSLPITGEAFSGCFWNSVSALCTVVTLSGVCLPQTLELLGHNVPSFLRRLSVDGWFSSGLLTSVYLLFFEGITSFLLAFELGGDDCAHNFLFLSVLLLIDSLLFVVAWWKGEGGGMMAIVQRAG